MKILVDIGHPAHVHFFKNLITRLDETGHEYLILARDKEVTFELLQELDFDFENKGIGGTGIYDRIIYFYKSLTLMQKTIVKFNPDLCFSHYSPVLALISKFNRLPHIMFNDTEQEPLFEQIVKFLKPHTYVPNCFLNNKIKEMNFFPSYMELAYLHPDVFKADYTIQETLGDDYSLLRFVSHKAIHDFGIKKPSLSYKGMLVEKLKPYGNVWITSEADLPKELKPFLFPLPPEKMHSAIAGANIIVGDSGTMAAEAAVLGIPSVFIHENRLGYIKELEEKFQLVHQFTYTTKGFEKAINQIDRILTMDNYSEIYKERRDNMLSEKINLTNLMVQIIKQTATSEE